jgi:putative transposase
VARRKGSIATDTVVGMSQRSSEKDPTQESRPPSEEELAAEGELVKAARDRGVALTGPDGLLKALTKTVVETAWTRR